MDEMGFVKIFFNILDALVDEGVLLYLVDKSGIIIENHCHPSKFFQKKIESMADEDLSKLKIDRSAKALPRKRWRKGLYWGGAAILLALSGLYAGGVISPSASVQVVTVSQVYPSQTFTLLNASGYVVPQRKAAVASKITGRLVSLMVEEGNQIKQGQIIARLENDDTLASRDQALANRKVAEANLAEAKAELNIATLTYGRNKRLLERQIVSKSEYDNAEARYKRARAAVAAAEAAIGASTAVLRGATVALDYSLIRAPFDAVVLTKNADIGDIVTPLGAATNAKAAVVTIADMHSLQVEADVSESNLGLIKSGQPCEIQLDAIPDTRFEGVVHMIVPTADRSKASVMVKIRFLQPDPRILPEMSAKVAFLSRPVKEAEQQRRTAVHHLALVKRGKQQALFILQDDHVKETVVLTGETFGDMIEILSGAKAGDRVVMKPDQLKDGAKIKIAEK
jgi:RND family efflux transporter MFP subunit